MTWLLPENNPLPSSLLGAWQNLRPCKFRPLLAGEWHVESRLGPAAESCADPRSAGAAPGKFPLVLWSETQGAVTWNHAPSRLFSCSHSTCVRRRTVLMLTTWSLCRPHRSRAESSTGCPPFRCWPQVSSRMGPRPLILLTALSINSGEPTTPLRVSNLLKHLAERRKALSL